MRRILFTVMASAALCVAAPAVALAHNGHHHHKRHHVRHETFVGHRHAGDVSGSPTGTAQPTAGTVTSFTNNTLTITLANGNTVSGQVTPDTEIKCENPEMQNGDNDGDDNGGGDDQGDAVFHSSDGGWGGGDQGGGDQGGDNNNAEMCTPATGMSVARAELTINSGGAFWDEVELISTTPSTTSTGTGTDS